MSVPAAIPAIAPVFIRLKERDMKRTAGDCISYSSLQINWLRCYARRIPGTRQ